MRRTSRIATLRRRFVLYAMAAVAVVLVLVGLAVNLTYDANATGELDAMLTLLSQGQGSFSRRPLSNNRGKGSLSDLDDETLEEELDEGIWEDWDYWEDWKPGGPFSNAPLLTPETAYATRWFSVTYDGTGSIAWVDLTNIASVDSEDLPRFVEIASRSGDGFGSVGDFRYLVTSTSGYHQAYFLDATTEFRAMRQLALLTTGVGVVAFALISVAVWFLAGRAIRPVAEADARQRRFITDASHELKTPLATIMTSLGVAEMDTGPSPFIDKAKSQTTRMAELVDELVTYTRLDEGEDREPTTFDASAATEDVASGFADRADARGNGLALEVASDLTYLGDEYGYRRLVSVLLDNATKYAVPGGPIRLSLQRYRKKGLQLVCENPADGIDEAQLPHLFERFYRPDDSRSRETGGFGIGLSIAREVVEQVGGTITATLQPPTAPDGPQTIRFEVLLP